MKHTVSPPTVVVAIDETPGQIRTGHAFYPVNETSYTGRHRADDDRPRLVRLDQDSYQPRHTHNDDGGKS